MSAPAVVILGAGPAGLAAAHELVARGATPVVLERTDAVGGISRTVDHQGYLFDLGGHRFFTRFPRVQALWEAVLGDELLVRPRLSRIFYGGRFYDYPLRAGNALRNLGPLESARCMASYARARLRPRGQETTFEQWVSNRFGDRLFDLFFRSYTEKVWGLPTHEIGADWASQRIKNLELGEAVRRSLPSRLRRRLGEEAVVPSLIERFHYPRRGPGQMYEAMRTRVEAGGGRVHTGQTVVRIERQGLRVERVVTREPDGGERTWPAEQVICSIPLTHLVRALRPAPPDAVLAAAAALRFRNLVTVDLIVDHPDLFPDNWIYVHEAGLQVGRIQNFKNWSPAMVPDPRTSSLGLEYFCSDGDALWRDEPASLLRLGAAEAQATGLLRGARVLDGTVVRVPKAYPVYHRGYAEHVAVIVRWLRGLENLQAVGRYGMFKYNNADHSTLTGLLAVDNLYGAETDLWAVNTDGEYHERG